jgi:GT2 family glycosyltransferase
MAEAKPVVSVVIATYNRPDLLSRTLDALEEQDGVGPFEVIVVDDASTDETRQLLERRAPHFPVPLITMRQECNGGPAKARNRGWRSSRAPLVCFTDDDCRPSPKWLASLVAAASPTIGLVQGRTEADPDQVHLWAPFTRAFPVMREEYGFYETCNIAYRRDVLEQLGGFDESFRFAYGEDTDLAWRAKAAGVGTTFADDAVVFHEVAPSDWLTYTKAMRRSESLVLLVSKHPGVRALSGQKLFWRPVHFAGGLVAISAIAVAARSRFRPGWFVLGVALMKYWQASRSERREARASMATWVALSPLTLVSDLYELAIMARASVRYRTLLL